MDCKCYHEETKYCALHDSLGRLGGISTVTVGVCWGTKEKEMCTCGGDLSKCNFYPKEKEETHPIVVAVDFDGTLFEDKFPEIGDPIWSMISYVKKLRSSGKQIILYTNREGKLLDDALEVCHKVGLEFDAVNENMRWRTELYGNDCRKIGADIYIDDKAINAKSLISELELLRES